MNNIKHMFMVAILAVILAGCGSQRKVVTQSAITDEFAMQLLRKVDSIASQKTIVATMAVDKEAAMYTEIVFTPVDTAVDVPPPEIIIDGKDGIHVKGGSVQSIRQYSTDTQKTEVQHQETETTASVARVDTLAVTQEHEAVVKEKAAADPYRWRYIWRIVATLVGVALVVLIVIFRKKVAGWMKNFIGIFARIFK